MKNCQIYFLSTIGRWYRKDLSRKDKGVSEKGGMFFIHKIIISFLSRIYEEWYIAKIINTCIRRISEIKVEGIILPIELEVDGYDLQI